MGGSRLVGDLFAVCFFRYHASRFLFRPSSGDQIAGKGAGRGRGIGMAVTVTVTV